MIQNGLNTGRRCEFKCYRNTRRGGNHSKLSGQSIRDVFIHRRGLSDFLRLGLISIGRETRTAKMCQALVYEEL